MSGFLNQELFHPATMEETLEAMGFSKNESKVYLQLLQIGKTTATEIAKQTKLHRSNVYDSLTKLIEKGIVAQYSEDNTRIYEATEPSNLLTILKDQQQKFESILPQLQLRKKMSSTESIVHMYTGVTPAKNTLFTLLEYDKPIYVFGTPPNISAVAKGFLQEFHKERVKRKIPIYHVYSKEAEKDFEEVGVNNMPYTYSKHLPDGMTLPMSTTICNDEVQLKFWTRGGSVVVFKSPDIADVYKSYFDHFWQQGTWVKQHMLTNLALQDFAPVNRTAFVTSYLLYDQIRKIGMPKEKQFYKKIDLEPIEEDMKKYLKKRPQASKNVYDRYLTIKNAVRSKNPGVVLICAAGLSPLGEELIEEGRTIIETDVKDVVLYKKQVFGNNPEIEEMDVLDKNHISMIKKKILELQPRNIAIIIEGLTPYMTPEQEALMHENMKEFSSIAPLTIYIHYYIGPQTLAEETKNVTPETPEEKSELLTNLALIHHTSAENPDEIIKKLGKEYNSVQLITTNNENPHKIYQCEVRM